MGMEAGGGGSVEFGIWSLVAVVYDWKDCFSPWGRDIMCNFQGVIFAVGAATFKENGTTF